MAQKRIVGPHREGDGMLGEGVVPRGAVKLSVQETLVLLGTLLESVPLGLPLRPCGPQQQSEYTEYCRVVMRVTSIHRALTVADSKRGEARYGCFLSKTCLNCYK